MRRIPDQIPELTQDLGCCGLARLQMGSVVGRMCEAPAGWNAAGALWGCSLAEAKLAPDEGTAMERWRGVFRGGESGGEHFLGGRGHQSQN